MEVQQFQQPRHFIRTCSVRDQPTISWIPTPAGLLVVEWSLLFYIRAAPCEPSSVKEFVYVRGSEYFRYAGQRVFTVQAYPQVGSSTLMFEATFYKHPR